ncbi:hypothetical protein K2173_012188 [Erythroxylum novogranatense]|uniref:Uncharacterized protein n=1 Tax=Erythroxylum novogranatense TaxID=1862640 RepID=A0AAV8T7D0_9ROSI|nr:hypothetical protein K2173_012188 [Erythroxylum novogranatense]
MTKSGYTGSLFTWYMKRNSQVVAKQRLDRAVGNSRWFLRFPECSVQSLVASVSDHDLLLLDTSPDSQHTVCHRFRFNNAWLQDANLEAVVVAGWRCEGEERRAGTDGGDLDRLQAEWNLLLEEDEVRRLQQAKLFWAQYGDMNSKYFHAHIKGRRKNNLITGLKNATGGWCRDRDGMHG